MIGLLISNESNLTVQLSFDRDNLRSKADFSVEVSVEFKRQCRSNVPDGTAVKSCPHSRVLAINVSVMGITLIGFGYSDNTRRAD